MNPNIQQEAEELDAFITVRLSEPEALAVGPSRDESELAGELVALANSAQPDPSFARKLETQLLEASKSKATAQGMVAAKSQDMSKKKTPPRQRSILPSPSASSRPLWWAAGALAATAVVAAVIAVFMVAQTPTANAQEIVEKAKATTGSLAAGGIQSLELHETRTSRTGTGETIRSVATRWFQAPGRWRVEIQTTVTGSNGQELPDRGSASVSVTDGTTVWYFDQKQNTLTINPLPGNLNGQTNLTAFGPQPDSLNTLLAQASSCYNPKLQGTATVAGRSVYIVDLGVMKCGAATPETNGPSTIWVDQETFLVLKYVQYSASGSEPLDTTEVTSLRINPTLDAGLFTFAPPPGATVQDFRPKPAPTGDQFQQQLASLAKQSAFPLFVPDYVPAGLAPRQPRNSSTGGIELDYVPPEQVDKPSAAILSGLLINEQPATYDLIVKWTEGAKPIQISKGQAWLRTDAPNPIGGGMDQAAYVLQDGTLVSIASFKIESAELVKVAGSLRTVPGSHAPLPNPTPPLLARVRQTVSFPVFIPTDVPAGLTPEPPVVTDKPASVQINYHSTDGAIALTVTNGPHGCCSDLSTIKGEAIQVAAGVTAHLVQDAGDNIGSWTLWWEQEGTVIQLSGPNLTRADLLKIAASLNKTAELGRTEAPPARPTPAPLPAPKFKILKPSWLPEPMTMQQDYQKAPPEFGSWVALTFLPKGADQPRTPLILLEKPKGLVTSGSSNPQATQQKIGGNDVSVTRTARECSTYEWNVGDVHLSLANPYNVSGSARYTCDQMAKIVESIR